MPTDDDPPPVARRADPERTSPASKVVARPAKQHRPAFSKTVHRAMDCPRCGKQVRAERPTTNGPVYLLLLVVWFAIGAALIHPLAGVAAAVAWRVYWWRDIGRAEAGGWACPACGSRCDSPN